MLKFACLVSPCIRAIATIKFVPDDFICISRSLDTKRLIKV